MPTCFGSIYTMCRLFLGPCTLFSDIEIATFFAELYRLLPNACQFNRSYYIPTSLDRNSKVLFSVVLKGLKSLHSLHGVHEVCMGLPPDVCINIKWSCYTFMHNLVHFESYIGRQYLCINYGIQVHNLDGVNHNWYINQMSSSIVQMG